ncbi:MAG: class I SAM-dependent RNA methyltransferase [Deltaproteobacteria bacterium]|nr:class I SAM-dependent RNA methyltransferase [Deltaproteobacteria bacterium]
MPMQKARKTIKITGLAFGGNGVGRMDDNGKVVFVPLTAPGDEAVVEITAEKKRFAEGALKEIINASPERVEPSCRWYGACGGCSWGHLTYNAQVDWKARILEDTLRRLGGISGVPFDEPARSPAPFHYRCRARFHCADGHIGFYGARSREVVPIDECPLLEERVNAAYAAIREAIASTDDRSVESVVIGAGAEGPAAAALHVHGRQNPALVKALARTEAIKGFEVRQAASGKLISTHGTVALASNISGVEIASGVSVFSQANRAQNRVLVDKVVEYAGLSGAERVVDLYCGCGNLSLPLALRAGFVTGVESEAAAVEYAKANAARNMPGNTAFHAAGAAAWLERNVKALEKDGTDVIILDPPRDGEFDAARTIARLRPSRVVYVSCAPPALARDAGHLALNGYRLTRAGLIDMFPQTYHVESIVRLDRV